jgi:hypothetical protein
MKTLAYNQYDEKTINQKLINSSLVLTKVVFLLFVFWVFAFVINQKSNTYFSQDSSFTQVLSLDYCGEYINIQTPNYQTNKNHYQNLSFKLFSPINPLLFLEVKSLILTSFNDDASNKFIRKLIFPFHVFW